MKSLSLILALLLALTLAIVSLFVGVSNVSLATLFAPDTSTDALRVLLVSRIPRTLALILAGSSMAIAGLIMQMLVRNRFVEPSTAGTTESAGLGLLTVTLIAPDTPIFGKMLVAAVFALAGTALFLRILRQVPLRVAAGAADRHHAGRRHFRRHHLLRLSFRFAAITWGMDDGGFFRRAARPL